MKKREVIIYAPNSMEWVPIHSELIKAKDDDDAERKAEKLVRMSRLPAVRAMDFSEDGKILVYLMANTRMGNIHLPKGRPDARRWRKDIDVEPPEPMPPVKRKILKEPKGKDEQKNKLPKPKRVPSLKLR